MNLKQRIDRLERETAPKVIGYLDTISAATEAEAMAAEAEMLADATLAAPVLGYAIASHYGAPALVRIPVTKTHEERLAELA